MASLRVSLVLKLLFFALLLIASAVSATDNTPSTRKMAMEYKRVGKAVVVAKINQYADVPWGGGYVPPILSNP